jgi:hypothetical protein
MLLEWSWIGFGVGLLGAFIMEFIRIIRDNKSLTEVIAVGNAYLRTRKINKVALSLTFVYILLGGIIAGIFANTLQEAFFYGIFWEALFTFVITNGGKK